MARAMKDSGIEWIGEIPEEWVIQKNKYLLTELYSGGTPTSSNENFYSDIGIPFVSIRDMSTVDFVENTKKRVTDLGIADKNLKILKSGTVLYSIYATIGAVSELRVDATISQAILALTLNDKTNKSYYKYNLRAMEDYIFFSANGNTQFNLNAEKVWNFNFCSPPLVEQQHIADFLDKKCAEIDSVIADTQKTIEEYKALKQSIITEAVTKGIRKNRKMKDSGIEWIGEIPEEWGIEKGKHILKYLQKPIRDNDGVITCFRDGEVTLRSNRREDGFTFAIQEFGYQGIDAGDLVIHGMDGFAGAIGISDSRGKGSPVLNVLDCDENKKYIMYYLRNLAYNGVFIALATGIRVRSCDTSWNKIKELLYPIPSKSEQESIVAYIDERLKKIDDLIFSKQQLLTELESYKKSLIYEYVTGKKEVTLWQ